jgi:hypothetical protein
MAGKAEPLLDPEDVKAVIVDLGPDDPIRPGIKIPPIGEDQLVGWARRRLKALGAKTEQVFTSGEGPLT